MAPPSLYDVDHTEENMPLTDLIELSAMPTGRVIWVFNRLAAVAAERELGWVQPRLDGPILHARETYEMETAWALSRDVRPGANPAAAAIDPKLDNALGGIYRNTSTMLQGLSGTPIADAARVVLANYFPNGVAAVTQQPMVEQLISTECIVAGLRTTHAAQAQLLGLAPLLEHVERLLSEYSLALSKPNERAVEFSQLTARRAQDHHNLRVFVARLITRLEDHPDEADAIDALWAEIHTSQEAVRDLRKRRRAVKDVDPDTGAPVDEG
jgi:hypothetical protein